MHSSRPSSFRRGGFRTMASREDSITPQPIEVVIPPASEAATSGVASSIRTILFHVHDDDSLMGRLELVLTLARACGAHVHCLHVMPIEAYAVVDALGTFVHKDIVRALEEEAGNLRARLESKLSAEDILWDYEEITGELAAHIVQRAAL